MENDDVDKMKEYLGIFPFDVPDAIADIASRSYGTLENNEHEALSHFIKSMMPTIKFNYMGRIVTLIPSRFGIAMGSLEFAYEPADDEPVYVEKYFDLDDEEKLIHVITRIHNMIKNGMFQRYIEAAYRKKHGY
jgi:hypothetical protein